MKKILIFWLWFQWWKYVKYFCNKWFKIYWVTKSWLNKSLIEWVDEIYSFDAIEKNIIFFEKFDLIIVSVKPLLEQENVLNLLLSFDLKVKIVIEKPITSLQKHLELLLKRENYYFYIDEIILYNIYLKCFIQPKEKIFVKSISDIDIIEHALWGFLLLNNFEIILKYLTFVFIEDNKTNNLFYKIINKKYSFIMNKWDIAINTKKICNLDFWKSLDFILNLNDEKNKLVKENYNLLNTFLSKLLYK